MAEIMTWATWKKKNKHLPKYTSRDSTKGWSAAKVTPTMKYYGYTCDTDNDIDCDKRKPKQILKEDFQHIIEKASEVVYFVVIPTRSYAGYYKYLDVYWKTKSDSA